MTMNAFQKAGLPADVAAALTEVQRLRISWVDGAAAGTKMDVAAMRTEDTLLSAGKFADTFAAPTDDIANITIQPTKASGTITISGNPVADETFVVNGVTYTFKATPTDKKHVKITAGNNTTMAAAAAAAINTVENSRDTIGNQAVPQVVATSALGVVTITATADGPGNGPVVTDTGTTITISNTDPAAVTATFVSAGNTDAVTITPPGVTAVVFTIKTTPVNLEIDMGVKASDTLQAVETARIINAYEAKYGSLDVVATSALGVVTIRPKSVKKGNIITLTESATNVAVSGSGFLAGGTLTGGIKSTTDLSVATLCLVWFDKA